MRAYDIIAAKRDGEVLSDEALAWVLDAYVNNVVADYQMAALLMAIYLNGMTAGELAVWTDCMMRSGRVMDLGAIPGMKVDKHSTGGVGDKVSIPLAPLVSACGVSVPMISGRGLGHTGGTLDKLESIPGFSVNLDPDRYASLVAEIGLCLIGQTDDLCPADRKLYALRDVTATVASIPLIASSIMSKKMAEGIDALVLDVKVGSGAFMKTLDDARTLAKTMVGIGTEMGREVVAYITDMSQPLGRMVGNALEIQESIDVLSGGGPDDLVDVTTTLGAEMLVLGKVAKDLAEGRARIEAARHDGSGLARFKRLVEHQGGDVSCIDDVSRLPQAAQTVTVPATTGGIVTAIAADEIGIAALILGAGRERKEDAIDPAVGLRLESKLGDTVEPGQPLATLFINDDGRLQDATARIAQAFTFDKDGAPAPPLIVERITR